MEPLCYGGSEQGSGKPVSSVLLQLDGSLSYENRCCCIGQYVLDELKKWHSCPKKIRVSDSTVAKCMSS